LVKYEYLDVRREKMTAVNLRGVPDQKKGKAHNVYLMASQRLAKIDSNASIQIDSTSEGHRACERPLYSARIEFSYNYKMYTEKKCILVKPV